MSDTEAVPLADIIHVLRLARRGWPEGCEWSTAGFASAVWNGFIADGDEVAPTEKGLAFLAKFDHVFPEEDQ